MSKLTKLKVMCQWITKLKHTTVYACPETPPLFYKRCSYTRLMYSLTDQTEITDRWLLSTFCDHCRNVCSTNQTTRHAQWPLLIYHQFITRLDIYSTWVCRAILNSLNYRALKNRRSIIELSTENIMFLSASLWQWKVFFVPLDTTSLPETS